MIGLIVSGLSRAVGGYFEHKSKQSVAKSNLGDVAWETAQAKASDDSWKDELWTCVFVLIIFASFIEPLQPIMARGFAFLKTAPDFIQYGILASIAASFGLKSIGKFKK